MLSLYPSFPPSLPLSLCGEQLLLECQCSADSKVKDNDCFTALHKVTLSLSVLVSASVSVSASLPVP
eukprot:3764004-Rhodomonas_salina.1